MNFMGLVDCNNFFVSCERLFRPDLVGRPVLVLSSNDGAIVARSEEVKQLGVPMGVPYFKVRDILTKHQTVIFSSNFELYKNVSDRVMMVLREELGEVSQYSIDEAFFGLKTKNVSEAQEKMKDLKVMIEKRVGVPVSIGVGSTMTIAKYASEKAKRATGVCVLGHKEWQKLCPQITLGEIWGVGTVTAKSFREHDLNSVEDLITADRGRIEKIFGVHGNRLRAELAGIPAKSLAKSSELQKSIMSTRSFAKTTTSLSTLEEALAYHVGKVAEELRFIGAKTSLVRVLLGTNRHSDWVLRGGSEEMHLQTPTSDTRVLMQMVKQLAKKLYEADVPYKKAGVVVSQITKTDTAQLQLFIVEQTKDEEGLMSIVDTLNHKLGNDTITIGRTKRHQVWDAKHEYRSPHYTTSWHEIPLVK